MQIPSKQQVEGLSAELADRGKDIPAYVDRLLTDLPPGTHPMTQFSIAVLALQVRPFHLNIILQQIPTELEH